MGWVQVVGRRAPCCTAPVFCAPVGVNLDFSNLRDLVLRWESHYITLNPRVINRRTS
jgi:hypothetical protein